ncbi:phosphoenolpyruvate-utilizing N-terminal domain-containing protein, partial [Cutibacterium granulosum]
MKTFSGLGVSAGIGQAPALLVEPAPGLPARDPKGDTDDDVARVTAALSKVADRLDARALEADPSAIGVLMATAMMARDPGLTSSVRTHLEEGDGPAHALWGAIDD